MSYRYPILLDVSDCLAVVVGGGPVGARKAAGLIDAGARRVRVVAPIFCEDLPAGVERLAATYQSQHLEGARLAFAATDSSAVNDAVVADAKRMGIWVNRADVDDATAGDFTVPAQWACGSMLVAVSASGSPAVAASVRDEIGKALDRRWVALADALQSLRPRIRNAGSLDSSRRRSLLKELSTPAALEVVAAGGEESLWRWALERYPELENA